MKIERRSVAESTIQDFAKYHNLTMAVTERMSDAIRTGCKRYYASFDNVEVSERCVLIGEYGDGDTEDEAIDNYAKRISEKNLVIDAFTNRKEVKAPRFLPYDQHSEGG